MVITIKGMVHCEWPLGEEEVERNTENNNSNDASNV